MALDLSRKQLKAKIIELCEYWIPILGLTHWQIAYNFKIRKHAATCEADPAYEQAIISFNITKILEQAENTDHIEDLVVHELCHCLTWDAATRARYTEVELEQLNTRVERAVIRAYRTGLDKTRPTS